VESYIDELTTVLVVTNEIQKWSGNRIVSLISTIKPLLRLQEALLHGVFES
jgi:hypothetical protein